MKINFLLLFLLIMGCSDNKVSSCRQLISFTLPLEEKINNLNDSNLETITNTAQSFQETSQAIINHGFEDSNLQNNALQLSLIYREYANTTIDFVNAYKIKDQEKAILSRQKLTELFTKQRQIVDTINSYCNG